MEGGGEGREEKRRTGNIGERGEHERGRWRSQVLTVSRMMRKAGRDNGGVRRGSRA